MTVVVAWGGNVSELEHALGSLLPRCRAADAEVIIVGPASIADRRRLRRVSADLRVIDAPGPVSRQQLREIGAGAASGDIVVLLDDERLFSTRVDRQFPDAARVDGERAGQASSAGVDRWLETLDLSANVAAASAPSKARPRTLVASWRNVAALLAELSRLRLLRASRAARS